jgi:HK97 family phage portal protein
MSPDDYRRVSGFRRSGAGVPTATRHVAVQAFNGVGLKDPELAEFLTTGRVSDGGPFISERRALRNSTFFRAVNLISGSIGMLPLHLWRRKADGTIEKAREHPLFNVLHRKPNDFQTASEFKSFMQSAALLDGNAYALKVRSRGAVRALIPLKRRSVKPKLSNSFELTFEYHRPNGGVAILSADDLFFFRSPVSIDGLNGVSLLDVCSDTLTIALQAQRAASKLVTKGNMASGALETDKRLGDEAIDHLKTSMAENYAGADAAGDWMILEEGLKAKVLGASAKDAQLSEMRKHEAEEMARFTGVPRPLLMFDETSWGSGIEQLGLFFRTYCLLMWFVIWEEAVWRMLDPSEQSTLYAKFNDGALLRGSLKDQAEFFGKALAGQPWMVQNEARENFEMNPKEGGDELGKAQGVSPSSTVTEPEPQPKPPKRQPTKVDDEED